MIDALTKKKAIELRLQGKSYLDISQIIGKSVPKSTMSSWFKDIQLSENVIKKLRDDNLDRLKSAREDLIINRWIERQEYFEQITRDNAHLASLLENKDVSKIVLATLFLAEGSKRSGSVTFCNSDPFVISLFLHLMRSCYRLHEEKLRCTVQCRADQDVKQLEMFWSSITSIPINQFSKAQVDKRSIGKPTMKSKYKGVCRINYFSAQVFNELSQIPRIIYQGR